MEVTQQPTKEWNGQTSHKFPKERRHVEAPKPKEVPHPLFSMNGRRHFETNPSKTQEWKSHNKHVGPVDHTNDK